MVSSKCSVQHCPTKARSRLTHFPFPLGDPELCNQWTQMCCREEPGWSPGSTSRVCEAHFTQVDIVTFTAGKSIKKKLREGVIPSQNLPPGAPMVVTLLSNVSSDNMVNVELETVVADGTHYDTMEHVSQEESYSMAVDDQSVLHETLGLEDDAKDLMPKSKKLKNGFDASIIPEDVAANTLNIDHRYFLNFLPQPKMQNVANGLDDCNVDEDVNKDDEIIRAPVAEDDFPNVDANIQNLNPDQKIEKLVSDLKLALRKNRSLAKANKSLRLQLHQASKKTLSMKTKHEIAREVLSPFFTPTQIDCFCRPKWLRSRNWTDKDFEIALALRRLMSKKAFGYLRRKRMIPMPSLTSLRKYQRIHNIVIHHSNHKTAGLINAKKNAAAAKKPTAKKTPNQAKNVYSNNEVMSSHQMVSDGTLTAIVENGNVMTLDSTGLIDASGNITFSNLGSTKIIQAIQIPVSTSTVLDDNGHQIQLQVVEAMPHQKLTRVKAIDENWKFIQISSSPDGSSTYAIEHK